MSLMQRRTTPSSDHHSTPNKRATPPLPPPSFSRRALESTANLANLLPTGTLLAFHLLTPLATNNGSCGDTATRSMTAILLLLLAMSCFLASLTDSFRAADGEVYYGFATRKGLLVFDHPAAEASGLPGDLGKYRLRSDDVIHAVLSVVVFVVVAMGDKNIVGCFFPSPGKETWELLKVVPLSVGLVCSLMFVIFPSIRHGIGFPVTSK